MLKLIISFLLLFVFEINFAQQDLPKDYLSKEFHKERRDELRKLMPENSVTVIFSYPEEVFSRDVNYIYHPNPDLFYFSGYKEPDAVLFIFKEMQNGNDGTYNELFFVRKRDSLREQWTGKRLGVNGTKEKLGFEHVYNSNEFKNFPLDLKKFNKILFDAPTENTAGMLGSLMSSFKEKGNIKYDNSNITNMFYRISNFVTPATVASRSKSLKARMDESEDNEFKTNPLLLELVNHPDSNTLFAVKEKIRQNPSPSQIYDKLISTLREIKTKPELELLRKTVFISAIAHQEVMKAIKPEMSESELSGIFFYVHKKYGAEDEAYPPIVGAGANGCILHYEENNLTQVRNQLVLMDVASEYHSYAADITRTIPSSGKFTEDQKKIYQLVYDAQEEIFKIAKEGTPFNKLDEKAREILAAGLIKLGIISKPNEVSRYYPHGCSHHMGLDVHDKSASEILKENMVITVEPGIYIPEGSPCDKKWWNIGVRIEDDVVIGKNKCEILSAAAPRKIEAIEKEMLKKNAFHSTTLPSLN